jgi:signal peptidase II
LIIKSFFIKELDLGLYAISAPQDLSLLVFDLEKQLILPHSSSTLNMVIMSRKEWVIVILPLILVWSLDRITKSWALGLEKILSYEVIHFALHFNRGVMLGLFSDLPTTLRIVSLSTAGAFLVCTYILIQYLLPIKSLKLRSGLSFLLGGIVGNVSDRILFGHVVDFIILGTRSFPSPAFNLADAFQWVGYFLIAWAILREGHLIWPEYNVRRQVWVKPNFQLKYCFILLTVGFGLSLVTCVFSYTYLKASLVALLGHNEVIEQRYLMPFLITFIVIVIGFSVALFTVGKILSHKIAGPLYAFEKYLDELLDKGDSSREFKLRAKDEFQELESLAQRLKEALVECQNLKK